MQRKFPSRSRPFCGSITERSEECCHCVARTSPAIFPPPGKATWSFELFVKTTLELRGWVGVKRGEKGRKCREPARHRVPFICGLSESTWAAPCRIPERMKADVRGQSTPNRCAADSPGGYSPGRFQKNKITKRCEFQFVKYQPSSEMLSERTVNKKPGSSPELGRKLSSAEISSLGSLHTGLLSGSGCYFHT